MEQILSYAKMQQQMKQSGQSTLFGGTDQQSSGLYLQAVDPATEKEKLEWKKNFWVCT